MPHFSVRKVVSRTYIILHESHASVDAEHSILTGFGFTACARHSIIDTPRTPYLLLTHVLTTEFAHTLHLISP